MRSIILVMSTVKAACVQATPVFLDKMAGAEKACALIREAAAEGADLVVLPEAFIPGYPIWVWTDTIADYDQTRRLYGRLVEEGVSVDDECVAALKECCADVGVTLSIGVSEVNSEGSGKSLYNSNLLIGPEGELIACHRKLVPTGPERMFWSQGDGSTIGPWDTAVGRVGCLICWENYMPLARFAQIAGGAQIIAAPTFDEGEPWISTMRHSAKEARAFYLNSTLAFRPCDLPDELAAVRDSYGEDQEKWVKGGGSSITGPDGDILAGPLSGAEGILYADLDLNVINAASWNLDAGGHYARPDVLSLHVDRRPKPPMV